MSSVVGDGLVLDSLMVCLLSNCVNTSLLSLSDFLDKNTIPIPMST